MKWNELKLGSAMTSGRTGLALTFAGKKEIPDSSALFNEFLPCHPAHQSTCCALTNNLNIL
jgi:hypothetical protein